MNGYYFKLGRAPRKFFCVLSLSLGLSGSLLASGVIAESIESESRENETIEEQCEALAQVQNEDVVDQAQSEESAQAQCKELAQSESEEVAQVQAEDEPESLTWARVDFIRNRVQLVPRDASGRRANIADILTLGDSLRTARASRAELRFNDGSLARIGERATFRFTPDTRNFQLSNGTILLLIPPGRGRSTIQTPNAVTGIQGSALFVRYIPETDTTIVGALTDNPDGPMVLFNRDGTEQQALRANEIGVIEGDQITELYQFDGTLFWQSSGLAEGFNYLSESTNTDELDGVRQEIREAISTQGRLSGDSVITNPEAFKVPEATIEEEINIDTEEPEIQFEGSPAEEYESSIEPVDEQSIEVGVNNSLELSEEEEVAINEADTTVSEEDSVVAESDDESEETAADESASETGDTGTSGGSASTSDDLGTDGSAGNVAGSDTASEASGSGIASDASGRDTASDASGGGTSSAGNTAGGVSGGGRSSAGNTAGSSSAPADAVTPGEEMDVTPGNTSPDDPSPDVGASAGEGVPDAAAADLGPVDAGSLGDGSTPVTTPDAGVNNDVGDGLGSASPSTLPDTAPDTQGTQSIPDSSMDLQTTDTAPSESFDTGATDAGAAAINAVPAAGAEEVTIPDVDDVTSGISETQVSQPVPTEVDNLSEIQTMHDLEGLEGENTGDDIPGAIPGSEK